MESVREAVERAMQALGKLDKGGDDRHERMMRAREARDTALGSGLPDWRWCHFGKPEFVARTASAGVISEHAAGWKRPSGSAIFSGPTGIGKTLCLVALGRGLVGRLGSDKPSEEDRWWLRRVRFVRAAHLVRAHRQHPLGSGEPPEVERAVTASLLLLDDVGNERDDRDGVMFDVVDRRYMRNRPTLLTTYLGPEQLANRYGDAFIRRLLDHGWFVTAERRSKATMEGGP